MPTLVAVAFAKWVEACRSLWPELAHPFDDGASLGDGVDGVVLHWPPRRPICLKSWFNARHFGPPPQLWALKTSLIPRWPRLRLSIQSPDV